METIVAEQTGLKVADRDAPHLFRIMGANGDTKLMWDPAVPDEVAAAKRIFDDLKRKGYDAYSVKKRGEPGDKVATFDPAAAKLIMAPAMKGG